MEFTYDYFGNTTLRVKNLLFNIEQQLLLFEKLFEQNPNLDWIPNGELQIKYADMLIESGLLTTTDFDKKAKTARQKSSPLEDFGLLDRKSSQITKKGKELLHLIESGEGKRIHNFLQIELTSLFFLNSLLTYEKQDGRTGTFWSYLNIFKSLNFRLSAEEFWLLPLINNFTIEEFIQHLQKIRQGMLSSDDVIVMAQEKDIIFRRKRDSFINDYRQSNDIVGDYFNTAKGAGEVGTIRLLMRLFEAMIINNTESFETFKAITQEQKIRKNYLSFIFNDLSYIDRNLETIYSHIQTYVSENFLPNFPVAFFNFVYICRVKNNLGDYYDLNRRYLKLTDSFEFKSDAVEISENLKVLLEHPNDLFIYNTILNLEYQENSLDVLFRDENIKLQLLKHGVDGAEALKARKRNLDREKLKHLLETRFTKKVLIEQIIPLFKNRSKINDNELFDLTTTEATIPTIFEYIVAIAWCYINENNFDIVLNAGMSLDSDLLPKSHAAGGNADIIIDYEDHVLMLEVTLTDSSNQRRAEMEPVSRHLGNLLLNIENSAKKNSTYAIFIAPYLDSNVISDFRGRRNMIYENYGRVIDGMNIIPMDTEDLSCLLENNTSYQSIRQNIYAVMESSERHGMTWYSEEVKPLYANRH